jgi:hypothetical protein
MSNHQNVAVPIRNELGALLKRSGEPLPSVGFYDLRGALRGVHCVEGSDSIEMRDDF